MCNIFNLKNVNMSVHKAMIMFNIWKYNFKSNKMKFKKWFYVIKKRFLEIVTTVLFCYYLMAKLHGWVYSEWNNIQVFLVWVRITASQKKISPDTRWSCLWLIKRYNIGITSHFCKCYVWVPGSRAFGGILALCELFWIMHCDNSLNHIQTMFLTWPWYSLYSCCTEDHVCMHWVVHPWMRDCLKYCFCP